MTKVSTNGAPRLSGVLRPVSVVAPQQSAVSVLFSLKTVLRVASLGMLTLGFLLGPGWFFLALVAALLPYVKPAKASEASEDCFQKEALIKLRATPTSEVWGTSNDTLFRDRYFGDVSGSLYVPGHDYRM